MMKKHSLFFYSVVSFSTIIVLVLITTVAFAGGLVLAPHLTGIAQADSLGPVTGFLSQPEAPTQMENDILAGYEDALTHIYDQALPSVVRIDVTKTVDQTAQFNFGSQNPFFSFPFQSPQQPDSYTMHGEGSGFVWDDAGYIVTNFHVVQEADTVEVTFADDTTIEAEIVGTDPDSDLAVLKVALPAAKLHPLPLADSDALKAGQISIAIGNPFGQEFTMTSGIVSAVGRTIRSGNTPFSIPEVIQTDAPINPGNSGGPLLNREGKVIGINTQIISRSGSSAGIGFAVPINTAKQIVPVLIKGEHYEYAWLGISGMDLTPDVADLMDLPADAQGAVIISVAKDSPAHDAGLRGSDKTLTVGGQELPFGGDVITAIDGHSVTSIEDLIVYLVDQTRPGDEVILDVIHPNGAPASVSVVLAPRPTSDDK